VKTSLDTTADISEKKAAPPGKKGRRVLGGKPRPRETTPDRVLPGMSARQPRNSGRA
jgi:hypothetical protein